MTLDVGRTRFELRREGDLWALAMTDLAQDQHEGRVLLTHEQVRALAAALSGRNQLTVEGARGGHIQVFTWPNLHFCSQERRQTISLEIHQDRDAIARLLKSGTRGEGGA